jgi:DUF177 domain-containing protein
VNTVRNPLRLNVGFITQKPVGTLRVFPFNYERVSLDNDLTLDQLTGQAQITRTPQGLVVEVELATVIDESCSRCLKDIQLPIKTEFTELYVFPGKTAPSDDLLLLPEDGFIDINAIAREQLLLEVPINPLCKPDCRGLCPVCGEILDDDHPEHDLEPGDPRMQILKSLLKK